MTIFSFGVATLSHNALALMCTHTHKVSEQMSEIERLVCLKSVLKPQALLLAQQLPLRHSKEHSSQAPWHGHSV